MRTGIILGLLFVAGSSLADNCREDVCVSAIDQDGAIELRARNNRNHPITYTLRVSSDDSSDPQTVTRTLQALASESAITLTLGGSRDLDFDYSYEWTVGDKNAQHDDDYLYALPYASGQSYRVLQGYGSRFSHTGQEAYAVDFDMREGTPVHAARAGVVARVEESHSRNCWADGCGKFANYIVILHTDGTTGEYYHLEKNGSVVTVGETVERGQKIGYSGNTGHSTMPHLHFGVYRASRLGASQSIPVRFLSAHGEITKPRRGRRYEAN
ncbi:MAG: M23 family metallopeptidase [Pseudomonadota bacterium]